MDKKLDILKEILKDERSKKIIFVSHCILNENIRYLGGAFRKGGIDEIIDEIQNHGIGIIQMKCPEQKAWGGVLKKHIWRPLGARNKFLYKIIKILLPFFIWNTKRVYKSIAKDVVAELTDYITSGYEVVGIIGIAGSPSCGVNTTLDIKKFMDFLANTNIDELDRNTMNTIGLKGSLVQGEGLFIKILKKELDNKNIKLNFFEHDLISEMGGQKNYKIII